MSLFIMWGEEKEVRDDIRVDFLLLQCGPGYQA